MAGRQDNRLLQQLSRDDPPRQWGWREDDKSKRHFWEPSSDFSEVEGRVEDSVISRVFSLENRVIMKCLIKFVNAITTADLGRGLRYNSTSGSWRTSIYSHLLSPMWQLLFWVWIIQMSFKYSFEEMQFHSSASITSMTLPTSSVLDKYPLLFLDNNSCHIPNFFSDTVLSSIIQ